MAQTEDVHDGHVYDLQFSGTVFSSDNGKQKVVVLVGAYAGTGRTTRALVARAKVSGTKVEPDLAELYTVPHEKLEVVHPVLGEKELKAVKAQLVKKITG
ncbi:hypothetical protein ABZ816_18710 [Actinosynnema sp. NPDC047251]|uniref:Uncharacterized protein n=1 Tax=Saccharothrix espanaensis (strain ATCC 51144 / DSM 44229 / JCM 9112 / NBRC 15066 / NRRL 15764) TaxID=1179773 RepID=K0K9K7_SACES|nr:hypothetical protein [Saccharothrix espanaensis]CCH33308.1 hypothetical protein BN6_60540 [Saccharothrix espanaensis DSM 44229]